MTNTLDKAKLFAAAAGLAVLTGCANKPINSGDFQISNREGNSGPMQYGSAACRQAKIEVLEQGAVAGYSRQYPYLTRSFMTPGFNQYSSDVAVTSGVSGRRFLLASSTIETQVANAMKGVALAGAGAVGLAGSVQQRGRYAPNQSFGTNLRRGVEAGVATAGAVAGTQIAIAGAEKLVDAAKTALNGGVSDAELRDRCKADVQAGAYDIQGQGAVQQQYVPAAPPQQQNNRYIPAPIPAYPGQYRPY